MFGSAYAATAVMAAVAVMLSTPGPSCGDGWDDDEPREGYLGHFGPAWGSVDGVDVIVFGWDGDPNPAGDDTGLQLNAGRRGSIYMIREDGSQLTLLSPDAGDGREVGDGGFAFDASPNVSSDGALVIYHTLRHGDGWSYDLVVASLDGRERERVTEGGSSQAAPAWSPDGSRIAFIEDGYVHTMAPDGSDVRSIVPDIPAAVHTPLWSPDGSRLAFWRWPRRDLPATLYVAGGDGSRLTRVLEGAGGGFHESHWRPAWSPDGRYLAFVTVDPETRIPTLATVDLETGAVEPLVRGGFGPFTWSPDGREVFYGSRHLATDDEQLSEAGLFAVAVDGEHAVRQVGTVAEEVRGLAWSPDGSRLAVRTRSFVVYTVAPDGSALRVLARENREGKLVAGEAAE